MPVETPGFVMREFRETMTISNQKWFGEDMGWGANAQRRLEDGKKRFTKFELDELVSKEYLKKGDDWYRRFEHAMVGLPWSMDSRPTSAPEATDASNKVTYGPVSREQVLHQINAVLDQIDEGNLDLLYDMKRDELEKMAAKSILYTLHLVGLVQNAEFDPKNEQTANTLMLVVENVFQLIVSQTKDTKERLAEFESLNAHIKTLDAEDPDFPQWVALLAHKLEALEAWQRHELVLVRAVARFKGMVEIEKMTSQMLENMQKLDIDDLVV